MLIGKNKMKKYNYFDILDAESLEEYLSEKAQNGWMIKKISAMSLTFEKIEPRLINFFVDNTKHEMVKDQYALKSDYVNSYNEINLEYICGNETFQIFINNSDSKNFPRQELKFRNVFKEYYYFIFGLIILAINTYIIFLTKVGVISLLTSTSTIVFAISFILIIILNVIFFIIKFKKYRVVVKNKDLDLNIKKNFKQICLVKKIGTFVTIFLIITGFAAIISDWDSSNNTAKDEIPLSLEDFDQSITGKRQIYKDYSSSPLGTYVDCSDYIYTESKKKAYDDETKSYYYENIEDSKGEISYTVFKSKYDKILDRVLESTLKEYDEFFSDYKKDEIEAKKWGAKEAYVSHISEEKIIVYENAIITFSVSEVKYNEDDIEMIKEKLLNN
ncbi:MAG: DUF2812 domain-containing protein [Terrisporobacter othiniensis]|uniref:DUF2812 domain-containing protein n=1 Tax=Terrisporobacter petrolearius TaxID=1460447 RepID=UPI0022E4EA7F|nr:DUF2812 domain-containing protein [Terrisporobacter petrolearius]MDU4861134.1 DUF2812 domain-containing protein [Terrisporobacter othiniensis]MDU6994768.1 DUF2812 domain-containing protein [Terrisporobacter othiniensis]